jgi:hypothetical protein
MSKEQIGLSCRCLHGGETETPGTSKRAGSFYLLGDVG